MSAEGRTRRTRRWILAGALGLPIAAGAAWLGLGGRIGAAAPGSDAASGDEVGDVGAAAARYAPSEAELSALRALTTDEVRTFGSDEELATYADEAARLVAVRDARMAGAPIGCSIGSLAPLPWYDEPRDQGVERAGPVARGGPRAVVLRGNRLFSIALGEDGITVSDEEEVFASSWLEATVSLHDRAVVVVHRAEAGDVELTFFELDEEGRFGSAERRTLAGGTRITPVGTFRVRDRVLVLAQHALVDRRNGEPRVALPRWRTEGGEAALSSAQLVRPLLATDEPSALLVVECALADPGRPCVTRGVLGASVSQWHVSQQASYLVAPDPTADGVLVYRLAHCASPECPTEGAVGVARAALREVSTMFLDGGTLHLLDTPEEAVPTLASIPAEAFGASPRVSGAARARALEGPPFRGAPIAFAPGWALYGTRGSGERRAALHACSLETARCARLELDGRVDEIETVGRYAVALDRERAQVSVVSLGARPARVGHRRLPPGEEPRSVAGSTAGVLAITTVAHPDEPERSGHGVRVSYYRLPDLAPAGQTGLVPSVPEEQAFGPIDLELAPIGDVLLQTRAVDGTRREVARAALPPPSEP